MRLAVIDIGSNTIRLLVAAIDKGHVTPLIHKRAITRLASGLYESDTIAHAPLQKTQQAIREFVSIAREAGVTHLMAAATSALREANNGNAAAHAIEEAAGIRVDIISGREEAETTALGVMQGFDKINNALIFDLGGGSTEFISIIKGELNKTASIPTGVVKLHDGAITSDPPSNDDIAQLNRQCKNAALMAAEKFSGQMPKDKLIATAGTATTLAAIDLELAQYDWIKVQGHTIDMQRVLKIQQKLLSVTLEERKNIIGIEEGRADLIIAGTSLTIRVMETFGFNSITVSDHGLLEGLAVKLQRHLESGDAGYELR